MSNIDEIEKSIINDGYIDNSRLWRRWIMAQMLRHCDSYDNSYDNYSKNGYGPGFDKYFISGKPYHYTWKTTLQELNTLSKLYGEELKKRERFFNKSVVFQMLDRYAIELQKYINKAHKKVDSSGETYITLPKIGRLYTYEIPLYMKRLNKFINAIKCEQNTYRKIYLQINTFMKLYPININLPKSDAWKNAFKGAGAYYTMDNMIKFHNCYIYNSNDQKLSTKESLDLLETLTDSYRQEYYKLYSFMRKFMKDNNYDYNTLMNEINE